MMEGHETSKSEIAQNATESLPRLLASNQMKKSYTGEMTKGLLFSELACREADRLNTATVSTVSGCTKEVSGIINALYFTERILCLP